jgi:hypothetical protein
MILMPELVRGTRHRYHQYKSAAGVSKLGRKELYPLNGCNRSKTVQAYTHSQTVPVSCLAINESLWSGGKT